ncbi:magnesium protoporphyrin IX methyltransferase [Novosphingobium sp. SG916]|uniref:magnesium protoporphyrin IX methyltransferase n=1 Tax=unclassified Novosphingobium TaxID=2644732 RepID=UPI00179F3B58|nr:magnesium-protoporphyrin O-methyltransferase [Novosphingobium sp. SG919]NMN87276.1 magnesium-protoporphyrin O-methyltransferase [Novosphingobium sp. SG916]
MMSTHPLSPYELQRERLAQYFDGSARKAWIDLTSNAKVSGIRATVRAGRDAMRAQLLGWLPQDLRRCTVLDAGCGTGSLSVEAAWRGAAVTAVDVAGGLVDIARQRAPGFLGHGRIDWHVGDMLDPPGAPFDHVVAMDSLIHYPLDDMVWAVERLAARCTRSLLFTFAPHTRLLGAMHAVGQTFPRANRSPAIQPIPPAALRARLDALDAWQVGRTGRISSGFYISQALELVRR